MDAGMTRWSSRPLGELCEITIGKTPPRGERHYWGAGEPWLSIADMNAGRDLRSTKEQISRTAVQEKMSGRLVEPGTLLLSFKLSVGKLGFARVPMYTNEAIAALPIRDAGRMSAEYLYWALRTADLLREADDAAMGKNLNKKKLANFPVPVPPLVEQKRIAAVLDQVDTLRTKRRKAIARLDDLTQSVFLSMFEGAGEDWVNTTVGDLATPGKSSIRTGPFGSQLLHEEFTESGVPVLGIDNAVQNTFQWGKRRYISEEKYLQLSRYTVHPGDLLITIMGTCGRCAVVPKEIPKSINTKHLCCITLDQEKCLSEFLHDYFLMHSDSQDYLTKNTKGAVMGGLNMGLIKALPVSLPPMEIQRSYVDRVRTVHELQDHHRTHLAALDELFISLQQRAFTGTLWDHGGEAGAA